ncbi:MAG: hypothetical protein IT425_01685 [Pirellulales bacterium]|nr:hypothetical protein [Pirellulales bacterium]
MASGTKPEGIPLAPFKYAVLSDLRKGRKSLAAQPLRTLPIDRQQLRKYPPMR